MEYENAPRGHLDFLVCCARTLAPRSGSVKTIAVTGMLVLSAASVIFGMLALTRFDNTPGRTGATPVNWPASATVHHSDRKPQLLIFLHPFCSCSEATLHELALLPPRAQITVLFYRPGPGSEWRAQRLWTMAQALPGATVHWDDGGKEARRFGARTSGYVLLYDTAGKLLFRGGVTASRGHEGDNAGLESLDASLRSGLPARMPSRVFGCGLGDEQEQQIEE